MKDEEKNECFRGAVDVDAGYAYLSLGKIRLLGPQAFEDAA